MRQGATGVGGGDSDAKIATKSLEYECDETLQRKIPLTHLRSAPWSSGASFRRDGALGIDLLGFGVGAAIKKPWGFQEATRKLENAPGLYPRSKVSNGPTRRSASSPMPTSR